jgi:hypothetical protein
MTQTITRVNGSLAKTGTVYTLNTNAYLIAIKNTSNAAIDLRAEDSYIDASTQMPNSLYEVIVKEISPLAYYAPNDNSGLIHVIMEKSINDAAELQTRIRRISGADILGTTSSSTLTTTAAVSTMAGATVTGPGIAAGTTVSSVSAGTSLTLSSAVTTGYSTAVVFTVTMDLTGSTVSPATAITIAP